MKKPKFILEFEDIPTPRHRMEELPVEARAGNFVEVEKGFTEEQARAEARRCLSCRRCIGCGLCLAECDRKAIVYEEEPKTLDLEVDAVILAPGAATFEANRKRDLGYGTSANVITSLEMERLLSPTGPFGGRILRPFDGEIPKRLAVIQCVGCREEAIGANYCSTVCCMQAIKQANSVKERIADSEITIFHRGIRPHGGDSETHFLRALEDPRIRFTEAEVSSVREVEGSGNLLLSHAADGQETSEEFDLVILSVAMAASRSAKALARKARARTNKYGFCTTGYLRPLKTTAESVLVAGAFSGPKGIGESVCEATGAAASILASMGGGRPAAEETGPAGPPPAAGTAVLLCRYGLMSNGFSDPRGLKQMLSKIERVAWVHDEEFLCRAVRRTEFREALREREIGTLVATCYGASHQALFDHGLKDEEAKPVVRLLDLGSAEAATDRWVGDQVREQMASTGAVPGRRKILARALVVGGGAAGLSAALSLAGQGIQVDLLGFGSPLGGRLGRLRLAVDGEEKPQEILGSLLEAVKASERIEIHTDTRVTGISGEPGAYRVSATKDGSKVDFSAGAIVLATGAADYEPTEFPGDGRILTQAELEELLASEPPEVNRIAMIQCVGSRSEDYPYCSQVCCSQAILNALRLKTARPEAEVTILHRDIRVFGFDEDPYTEAAEAGVSFIKTAGQPSIVLGEPLKVEFTQDSGEPKVLESDLVILSTGFRPADGTQALAEGAGVALDESGYFKPLERTLHPVESTREGVFICGLAAGPKPITDCITEGLAAAGRAAAFLREQG